MQPCEPIAVRFVQTKRMKKGLFQILLMLVLGCLVIEDATHCFSWGVDEQVEVEDSKKKSEEESEKKESDSDKSKDRPQPFPLHRLFSEPESDVIFHVHLLPGSIAHLDIFSPPPERA